MIILFFNLIFLHFLAMSLGPSRLMSQISLAEPTVNLNNINRHKGHKKHSITPVESKTQLIDWHLY